MVGGTGNGGTGINIRNRVTHITPLHRRELSCRYNRSGDKSVFRFNLGKAGTVISKRTSVRNAKTITIPISYSTGPLRAERCTIKG